MTRPAILIHGPTASGKTALAIALARRLGGVIINADAMQVYRDLEVLTARPTAEEEAAAPHRLFGVLDAGELGSVARWVDLARAEVDRARADGLVPIVAGGTGLYIQALVEGLSIVPETPAEARIEARTLVAAGEDAARSRLRELDPAANSRIAGYDRQRLARALEVAIGHGRPLSEFRDRSSAVLKPGEWVCAALTPRRTDLYRRIDARARSMLDRGALEEVNRLRARGLAPDLPVLKAHGAPAFIEHLEGRITLEQALDLACRDTRRYAKRQMTWIAHQFTFWPRIPSDDLDVRVRVIIALFNAVDRGFAKR
ncbi:tRNA (adenosine(37)-N6)-dimethylallyltransferase MiaA [bacterium]|nr:tRNA (adenosine(37)-N6)-dimethylallyltransferase MiaA [bacterium]